MSKLQKVTILGSGAGGLATATTLAQKGKEVVVASLENPEAARHLVERQGFDVVELQLHFHEKIKITTDPDEAFDATDAVAVVAPAQTRMKYLELAASRVSEEIPVILVPGGLGVGLACSDEVRKRGWVEINQLPFVARLVERDKLDIHYRLPHLWAGAYPASNTQFARDLIQHWFGGNVEETQNTLHCGLLNWNTILHPPIGLLNAARIEHGENFAFYRPDGGMSQAVADVMEVLDQERVAIGKALGFSLPRLASYLRGNQNPDEPLYQAVIEDDATGLVRAPKRIDHRYLTEDIPYGLMPLAALGKKTSVPTPMTNSLLALAQAIFGRQLLDQGLTLDKMRLEDTHL